MSAVRHTGARVVSSKVEATSAIERGSPYPIAGSASHQCVGLGVEAGAADIREAGLERGALNDDLLR
jgi:hypothetical protein